jgi:hypothetical protein
MANTDQFQITQNASYPSQLDSFEKKCSKPFGMAVGNAISSEWFSRGGGGICRFYSMQAEFMNRRIYAMGKVDMRKYYPRLGTNGDVSLLNLPRKSLSTIPKIVDLVVNGMVGRNYSIKANAIDPISQENKQEYRKKIQEDQNSLAFMQQAKADFGIDLSVMPIDQLPETKEELDIHLQMKWKPSNCLSNQLAIASVMEENMYNLTTDRQVKRDLVELGVGWVRNRFNSAKGIVIDYIDPIDMVYSKTKDPYFRDCFYKGHVKQILVSDIFIEYPHLLLPENEDTKIRIVNSCNEWYVYHQINASNQLKGTTNLLYFTYKTFKESYSKIKEKSTGEKVVSKADADFDESKLKEGQTNDFKRVSKVEEVLMEGVMVLGTNILLEWGVSKSMARPKSNKQKVCEQYNGMAPNFLDGEITSLVSRMIPIEDELNIIELKAAQIIQKINPDGIAIDLDAIASIDLGDGKAVGPNAMLNMYLQTGSYFYRSFGSDGNMNGAQKPFVEIQTGDSINKLTALRNESNGFLTKLTDVVGLNKASDASTPDKDSLVGIQKLAALSSNLATRHILHGSGYITLKTAEACSYRISDILKYYPSLRDDLIRKIGETAVEDLEYIKDLHLSDFAIFLELEMDDEERAELDKDLSESVIKGDITLADKYEVRSVKVLELAVEYLKILIKKRAKIVEDQKLREFKAKSDEDIRAAQEAEAAKQATGMLLTELKIKEIKALADGEIAKEKVRGEEDRLTETLKGANKIDWQYVVNSGAVAKVDKMEEEKNKRAVKEATMQSRMTVEKKKENPSPIDFEGEEEELKVFDVMED